jgi:hypothetical protein
MGALTQKSHTLIVIDEKAVVSGVELVLKEGERRARRAIRLFVFFLGVVRSEKSLFLCIGPNSPEKIRTEEGCAFGSCGDGWLPRYPTRWGWLLL